MIVTKTILIFDVFYFPLVNEKIESTSEQLNSCI